MATSKYKIKSEELYTGSDGSKEVLTSEDLATKQDKLIPGINITIAADGKTISATSGEPAEYLKDATATASTLTITKKDGSTVSFTPTAGSGLVDDVKVNGTTVVTDKVANIKLKTINNESIVGEGNIVIEGGGSSLPTGGLLDDALSKVIDTTKSVRIDPTGTLTKLYFNADCLDFADLMSITKTDNAYYAFCENSSDTTFTGIKFEFDTNNKYCFCHIIANNIKKQSFAVIFIDDTTISSTKYMRGVYSVNLSDLSVADKTSGQIEITFENPWAGKATWGTITIGEQNDKLKKLLSFNSDFLKNSWKSPFPEITKDIANNILTCSHTAGHKEGELFTPTTVLNSYYLNGNFDYTKFTSIWEQLTKSQSEGVNFYYLFSGIAADSTEYFLRIQDKTNDGGYDLYGNFCIYYKEYGSSDSDRYQCFYIKCSDMSAELGNFPSAKGIYKFDEDLWSFTLISDNELIQLSTAYTGRTEVSGIAVGQQNILFREFISPNKTFAITPEIKKVSWGAVSAVPAATYGQTELTEGEEITSLYFIDGSNFSDTISAALTDSGIERLGLGAYTDEEHTAMKQVLMLVNEGPMSYGMIGDMSILYCANATTAAYFTSMIAIEGGTGEITACKWYKMDMDTFSAIPLSQGDHLSDVLEILALEKLYCAVWSTDPSGKDANSVAKYLMSLNSAPVSSDSYLSIANNKIPVKTIKNTSIFGSGNLTVNELPDGGSNGQVVTKEVTVSGNINFEGANTFKDKADITSMVNKWTALGINSEGESAFAFVDSLLEEGATPLAANEAYLFSGNMDGMTMTMLAWLQDGANQVLLTSPFLEAKYGEQCWVDYNSFEKVSPVVLDFSVITNLYFGEDKKKTFDMTSISEADKTYIKNSSYYLFEAMTENATSKWTDIDHISYLTTAPTEPNTVGLKIVVLDSEPETKYNGYLYIIKGA